MKFTLGLLVCIFLATSSCGGSIVARKNTQKEELIRYCWVDGDKRPKMPEKCPENGVVKIVTWNHTPLVVSSLDEMAGPVLRAIEAWNAWVGFDLFVYSSLNPRADVLIFLGGRHPKWRGSAQHTMIENKLKCGILIFNDGMGDVGTLSHELGHCVGLDHDPSNKHSIMYPNNGRVLPGLENTDKNLIRDRYMKMTL